MKPENNDLEQLRKAWRDTGEYIDVKDNNDNPRKPNRGDTALDRLRTKYLSLAIGNLIGAPVMFCLIYYVSYHLRAHNLDYRLALSVSSAALLFATAVFGFLMWRGLGQIHLLTMPVNQVASLAVKYKRREFQGLLIGYPVAILWCVFYIYATGHDWFGPLVGGLLAMWLSIKSVHNTMKDYDLLSE